VPAPLHQPEILVSSEVEPAAPRAVENDRWANGVVAVLLADLLVIAGIAFFSRYFDYSTVAGVAVWHLFLAASGALLALAGARRWGLLLLSVGVVPLVPTSFFALNFVLKDSGASWATLPNASLVLAGLFILAGSGLYWINKD
jgi:hypothetical protein